MPEFDSQFAAAMGKPVEYSGKQLLRLDRFPIQGVGKLRLTFESANAKWRQGVGVDLRKVCDIRVNGNLITKKQWAILWQDAGVDVVEIELLGPAETAQIRNVWDNVGDGRIESWHNGAAMIVEEIPNGRRYRCNDGEPDDDFDDIVFRVERVV